MEKITTQFTYSSVQEARSNLIYKNIALFQYVHYWSSVGYLRIKMIPYLKLLSMLTSGAGRPPEL